MGTYATATSLAEKIEHLRQTGSSLIMNWGEDANSVWEVCWITGGERFCGFHSDLARALDIAELDARTHFGAHG